MPARVELFKPAQNLLMTLWPISDEVTVQIRNANDLRG